MIEVYDFSQTFPLDETPLDRFLPLMTSLFASAAYPATPGFSAATVAPVRKSLLAGESKLLQLVVVVVVVVLVTVVGSLWSPVAW